MSARIRYWTIGIALAAVGILLARVLAGQFVDRTAVRLGLYFLGVALAMGGLGVILLGMRRH